MEKPRLTNVEAFPVEYQGQNRICLRDPRAINGKALFISQEALFIISHFDGRHDILKIQEKYFQNFGRILYKAEVEEIIRTLDDSLLLENENYFNNKQKILDKYQASEIKESHHARISYPNDPTELRNWLNGFFEEIKCVHEPEKAGKVNSIKGIISPHIDFNRGGKSYAHAYKELSNISNEPTFLIFGTSHFTESTNPFILTKKKYSTPLGNAEVDSNIIKIIESSFDWDIYEGEIAHLTEHSIEFQVVFLQYLFSNRLKIVPILCNSFHQYIEKGVSPATDYKITEFLNTVRSIIKSYPEVYLIAGADLAHVGKRFGDKESVDDKTMNWIKERDLLSLSFSEKIDAENFYNSIKEEKDIRKICGLSPIYSLLSTIDAREGVLLDYDQALEPETGSVVSFASMVFYS